MFPTATFFVALLSAVSALPTDAEHAFKAPGPKDLRSPCPMVNTLANHGYLPRDGRNISIPQFVTALSESVNLDEAATKLVAVKALTASTTGNPNTIHLTDLDKHGVIEHDGSLSRGDAAQGDNHSFNQTIFDGFMANLPSDKITIADAAKARALRLAADKAANPSFDMGAAALQFSMLESALYLVMFGDGTIASKPMVKFFFEKEQLPYSLGFKKSASPITITQVKQVAGKIAAVKA